MAFSAKPTCLGVSLIALSACGGATTTPPMMTPPVAVGSYTEIRGNANVDVALGGVGIVGDLTGLLNDAEVLQNLAPSVLTGSFNPATGVLTVQGNGTTLITDSNGGEVLPDSGPAGSSVLFFISDDSTQANLTSEAFNMVPEAMRDGTTVQIARAGENEYFATILGTQNGLVGFDGLNVFGTIGVATDTRDMPTTGSATYTGHAFAFGANRSLTPAEDMAAPPFPADYRVTSRNDGTATTSVDFASATADVTATFDVSAEVVPQLFDQLQITDMRVVSDGLTGGTVTATLGGGAVLDVGSIRNSARGQFFGIDATDVRPDELHILGSAAGADGAVAFSLEGD